MLTLYVAVDETAHPTLERLDSPTTWVRVVCWEELADQLAETLKKGALVYVEGKLKLDRWTSQDGQRIGRAGRVEVGGGARGRSVGRQRRSRGRAQRPCVAAAGRSRDRGAREPGHDPASRVGAGQASGSWVERGKGRHDAPVAARGHRAWSRVIVRRRRGRPGSGLSGPLRHGTGSGVR